HRRRGTPIVPSRDGWPPRPHVVAPTRGRAAARGRAHDHLQLYRRRAPPDAVRLGCRGRRDPARRRAGGARRSCDRARAASARAPAARADDGLDGARTRSLRGTGARRERRNDVRGISGRATVLAVLLLAVARVASAGGDWNDKEIAWQGYEAGLAAAKN